MTWVKICGMTNLADALTAVDAGADAVGFVFYDKSPRNISAEAAREIIEKLPPSVEKVGVFVSASQPEPFEVAFLAGLTGVQSYPPPGDSAEQRTAKATGLSAFPEHTRFLIALTMEFFNHDQGIQSLASTFSNWRKTLPEGVSLPEELMDTIVLDSGDLRMPGGTGKIFNWGRALPVAQGIRQGGLRLVVAGGLTPANVAEAMQTLHPWGVDVSSGVESSPGKKDPEKVRAFVKAVREMDTKNNGDGS